MIAYTELFHSFQGEGKHTGCSSIFLRLWRCNLKCAGFGQPDPMNKDTWDLTFRDYDPKANGVTCYEQLPIFGKGCDSEYSHNKKYEYLAKKATAIELAHETIKLLPNGASDKWDKWGKTHLVVTGGECLMPHNQEALLEYFDALGFIARMPKFITFETNGTQALMPAFAEKIRQLRISGTNILFSVSPKLQHVTGERNSVAIRPDIVASYTEWAHVVLKPVVSTAEGCWEELEDVIAKFKAATHYDYDVYVMPVGATLEQQSDEYVEQLVTKALAKGYHVSVRTHVYVFGNKVNT